MRVALCMLRALSSALIARTGAACPQRGRLFQKARAFFSTTLAWRLWSGFQHVCTCACEPPRHPEARLHAIFDRRMTRPPCPRPLSFWWADLLAPPLGAAPGRPQPPSPGRRQRNRPTVETRSRDGLIPPDNLHQQPLPPNLTVCLWLDPPRVFRSVLPYPSIKRSAIRPMMRPCAPLPARSRLSRRRRRRRAGSLLWQRAAARSDFIALLFLSSNPGVQRCQGSR
jgi:hypothetical protein